MIIAFSGNHGSGKSTYAKFSYELLKKKNAKLVHIVDLSFLGILNNLFGGKPERENKNLERQKEFSKPWHLFTRSLLYIADLKIFWVYLFLSRKKILICDRYFYDKVSNFNSKSNVLKFYLSIFKIFLPKPKINFFIEVEPSEAHKRKPEYDLRFFLERDNSYNVIKRNIPNKVILSGTLKQNKDKIKKELGSLFL